MSIVLLFLAGSLSLFGQEENAVFRSDVALVRVDAQVLDRDNRAITGLRMQDFVLRDEGKIQVIRNFAREEMPVDVLMLLDVSASMRPHVERIATAARHALNVLGKEDRVAIMVFDRSTRVRLPFRSSRDDIERGFDQVLRQESFNGGTDITRGLLDAAEYVGRSARREACRAIVILTDDETEKERDDARVTRALERADAVLSALIAPDAMRSRSQYPGGGGNYPRRRSSGSWPGTTFPGGGGGGPLGGVILGPGGRGGQGGGMGSRTHSAGTSEIARASGGDSMPVDDSSALETTLQRIRQRYALYFLVPPGAQPGQERNIEVALADSARRRYDQAEVRFRRTYFAPGKQGDKITFDSATEVTQVPSSSGGGSNSDSSEVPRIRRKANVDGSSGRGPSPSIITAEPPAPVAQAKESAAEVAQPNPPAPAAPPSESPGPRRGWRRVDESAPSTGPITPNKPADPPPADKPKQP